MDIERLKRQHEDIRSTLEQLKKLIVKDTIEDDPMAAATLLNQLAGKLRIHLSTEDQHMYPKLLNSSDEKIRTMAQDYINEMGNISKEFTEFKVKFNTKTKIMQDVTEFKCETVRVFKLLENRINREDEELYPSL